MQVGNFFCFLCTWTDWLLSFSHKFTLLLPPLLFFLLSTGLRSVVIRCSFPFPPSLFCSHLLSSALFLFLSTPLFCYAPFCFALLFSPPFLSVLFLFVGLLCSLRSSSALLPSTFLRLYEHLI